MSRNLGAGNPWLLWPSALATALLLGVSVSFPRAGAIDHLWLGVLPWLTFLWGVGAWIVATRGRRLQVVGPFSLAVLMLLSIFAVRPLLMLRVSQFDFYGTSIVRGFNGAAFAGLLAMVSLTVGYFASSYTPSGMPKADGRSHSLPRAMSLGVLLSASWFVGMAAIGGGVEFLSRLFGGRTEEISNVLHGVPVAIGVMPVAGVLLLCVVRIQEERRRALSAVEKLLFWGVVIFAVVPPLALGQRRYLLPCLVAAVVATSVPRARERLSPAVIVAAPIFFVLLAVVPFVRSSGSREVPGLGGAVSSDLAAEGLWGAVERFFLSYDTEMFSYVAFLFPKLGTDYPYGLGRGTLGDALLNPFPSSITPFPLWSDRLLTWTFGGGCADGPFCPVGSIVGVLLYDFGLPGVVLGCLLVGILFKRVPGWLSSQEASGLAAALTLAAFAPVLIRGNSVNIAYVALWAWLIAAPMLRLTRQRNERALDKYGASVTGSVASCANRSRSC